MSQPISATQRWLVLSILCCALWPSPPAGAQSAGDAVLVDRLDRLERDMRDVQRFVYRGGAPPAQAGQGAAPPGDQVLAARLAQAEDRVRQLEEALRGLTGQLERQVYTNNQLSQRVEKLVGDVDFRLKDVEREIGILRQGAAVAAPGAQAAAPAPAPRPAAPPADEGGLPAGNAMQRYDHAFALVRKQDFPAAERAFREFLARHPNDKLAGNAQFWLGQTHFVRKQFEPAAKAFLEGYTKHPESSKAPESLLRLGLSLHAMGQNKEACAAWAEVGRKFANAEPRIKDEAVRELKENNCR
ncbi:MAG: tol-pal system protein YbgF [Alphaproteobacteria bacterium]|nr:tol-pal system protein YbgF [Alphaproteobacteria bacterium]